MLGQLSFLGQSREPPGRTWPRRTGCCKGTLQEGHDLVGLDVAKGPSTRRLLGLCWKAIMTPRSTPKSSLHHDRRCCHTMGLVIMPFVIQILHVLVVVLIRSPRWRTSTMPRPRQERTMLFDERRMHLLCPLLTLVSGDLLRHRGCYGRLLGRHGGGDCLISLHGHNACCFLMVI